MMKKVLARTFGFFLLFCLAISVAHSQDVEKTTNFTEIKGKVVDSSGRPIEKFTVNITVYDYSKGGFGVSPEAAGEFKGDFEDGEFQFDVEEPIRINEKVYINRTVTAAGYMELGNRGFKQLSSFKGDFGKIKLSRAIKITGKFVLPVGQEEEELMAPRIYLAEKLNRIVPNYNNTFQRGGKVEKDGSFEAIVPEDIKLNITASCDNAATAEQQFTIKKSESEEDEQNLGEIKLKEGVPVTGTVVNRNGKPVEGQIVQLQQTVEKNNFIQNYVYGYAVSDAEGKFELPPRLGKATIALVKQAWIDGKQLKVKGDLIMAKSVSMDLKVGNPVPDIEIRESKTWTVSGVLNYDKTTEMTLNLRSGYSGGQQYEHEVDDQGRFEFQVVHESKPWLSVYGYKGSDFYLASMSGSSLSQYRDQFTGNPESSQNLFQMKKLTSDIGPLEFTLVKQHVDTRSWRDRLFDWYLFGSD